MKKVILILTLLFTSFYAVDAQEANATNSKITIDDYETYIDAKLNIKFREATIEALGLSKEEIIDFDPLFRAYNKDKTALVEKKYNLIESYYEEMKEDDSIKDETDETGDFFEDYWEIEIDEMQLKKRYYDRMDEVMSPSKAMNFFLLEESLQNRIEQNYFATSIPVILEIERPFFIKFEKEVANIDEFTSKGMPNVQYKNEIEAFKNWAMNHSGSVTLDHDYTRNGLYKLVAAIEAIGVANNTNMSAYNDQMTKIKKLADELQEDKYSDVHADKANVAFGMVADLLLALQAKNHFDKITVNNVRTAANKINPDVLMTKQAKHIHNFFDAALQSINKMSEQTTWVSQK